MNIRYSLLSALLILANSPLAVHSQTLKGKLSVKGGSLAAADFSLVAQVGDSIKSGTVAADGKFSIAGVSTDARLSLLYRSNFYSPLVLAVKKGKVVKPFTAASAGGFCSSGSPRVVLATSKKTKGALNIEVNPTLGVAYAKKVAADQKKNLTKGVSAEAASNCVPGGLSNAEAQAVRVRMLAGTPEDVDGDGSSNQNDVDDDDDGLSDTFDPDNDDDGIIDDADPDNNDADRGGHLFYFQQLHMDRDASFHPKLQTVTTEMIDSALQTHGGLALEVKSGTKVELNCGAAEGSTGQGLPWCSAGGTGRSLEPFPNGAEFPEEFDSDGNGKAEITAGPSQDLQLAPGASSSQIQPGDTFIEEVSEGSVVTKYVGVLNSVVHTVPGVVSITTGAGTFTLDYPATATSVGTYADPVLVPASGDASITVNVFPPLYQTAAGRVVPGVLTFITNLPNGPCNYNAQTQTCPGGNGSGPGLLPGSLYSNPSSGWEIAPDGVRSNTIDKTVEESQALSYTVNLTGSGGVTGWDSGEYLTVPIQAMDGNGTTSAHAVIFKRQ